MQYLCLPVCISCVYACVCVCVRLMTTRGKSEAQELMTMYSCPPRSFCLLPLLDMSNKIGWWSIVGLEGKLVFRVKSKLLFISLETMIRTKRFVDSKAMDVERLQSIENGVCVPLIRSHVCPITSLHRSSFVTSIICLLLNGLCTAEERVSSAANHRDGGQCDLVGDHADLQSSNCSELGDSVLADRDFRWSVDVVGSR